MSNCMAHPLGCHAMPAPARPPRTYWRLPAVVDVDITPPAPARRADALDLLVTRIQTVRRSMRRPT